MDPLSDAIRERIRASRRACVFTGAGVSAESGISTFRDSDGLWEKYRVEDLVTPEAFSRDPAAVWRWHAWIQGVTFAAEPNAAHKAIAAMDDLYPDFLVITQNIDTLHERAGTRRMVKLHGDIMEILCLEENAVITLDAPVDMQAIRGADSLPRCPRCGGRCRPNVVWFGELLPLHPLETGRAFASACDFLLIVGTSGVVGGGYGFAELARRAGALIIEINPRPSELSNLADLCIRRPAAEAVPLILIRS